MNLRRGLESLKLQMQGKTKRKSMKTLQIKDQVMALKVHSLPPSVQGLLMFLMMKKIAQSVLDNLLLKL